MGKKVEKNSQILAQENLKMDNKQYESAQKNGIYYGRGKSRFGKKTIMDFVRGENKLICTKIIDKQQTI